MCLVGDDLDGWIIPSVVVRCGVASQIVWSSLKKEEELPGVFFNFNEWRFPGRDTYFPLVVIHSTSNRDEG